MPEAAAKAEGIDESADTPAEEPLLDLVRTPWVGDLDGMLERRLIRVLIVPSRTMYFLEQGTPRGIVAEFQRAFESFINKRFPPQAKHLKTSVAVVPTHRDDLVPALLEGRGDIAAANLTITPAREAQIDFSEPTSKEVNEIIVTGPLRQRSPPWRTWLERRLWHADHQATGSTCSGSTSAFGRKAKSRSVSCPRRKRFRTRT